MPSMQLYNGSPLTLGSAAPYTGSGGLNWLGSISSGLDLFERFRGIVNPPRPVPAAPVPAGAVPAPARAAWYQNPLVMGGAVLVLIVALVLFARRK